MAGELPPLKGWEAYRSQLAEDMPKLATRKSSENALGVLTAAVYGAASC